MVGRTLGRYRIIEQLGAGGMGAVYRAHDERLNRDVAIKVLTPRTFDNEDARSRFRHEALALSRVNHPNIASIYDFETVEGQDLLVMELVQGTTLAEQVRNGSMSEKEVLALGTQLMRGLAASHDAGIIHRDLKPGNIRVTPDGRLKILDFGLAKEVRPAAPADATTIAATKQGQVVGTVPNMAPEQLRAEKVDQRTDIYGAGTVLYEMATGRPPFDEAATALLVDDILNRPPVPPRSLNGRVSEGLEQVILKTLEKDADFRYQAAREVAVDLERLAQSSAGHRATASPRTVRRGRRRLIFPLSAGTAAVAAVALFLVLANRPALSFAAHDWILLSTIENTTGDPVFDRSLDTAFRVSLEQSLHANVFSQARVDAVLKRMGRSKVERIDITVGREICEREGIRGLVLPAIAQVGRQYSVTARLVDPLTGDAVRSYAERANGKDMVLAAVDKVSGRLRRDLGESLQAMRQASMPLPQVTTTSLDALKAHAEARNRQMKGDYAGALRLFRQAVQLDSDFALAHAGIGGLLSSFIFNDAAGGRAELETAMKLRDRVTPRERLGIEMDYHSSLGHTEEAIRTYRLYLASWPDDPNQRYNLGNMLRASNQIPEAIEQYRHTLLIDPSYTPAHVNLATSLSIQGLFKESLVSWEKAFALEPSWIVNGNLNHEYGFTLVSDGNHAKAREIFDLAIKDKTLHAAGLRSAALLDLYEGKFRSAEGRLREAMVANKAGNAPLSEARNRLFLAIALAGRDERAAAARELEASFKLRNEKQPQAWLWARVAALYAALELVPRAEAIAAVVRAETAADAVAQLSTLHWLEGELELAHGRAAPAVEKIQLADTENRTPITQEALARAYRSAGDTARAIGAYESLVADPGKNCLGWEPQLSCEVAMYDLATLYRADKQPAKARRQLDDLLTLWQGADADLPLLQRARSLRAELEKE